MSRIGIYGISANPPTGETGHLGVAKHLAMSGFLDEIWVLPVYQHMYRSKKKMVSFEHRMEMCKLMFPSVSTSKCTVRVLNLEKASCDAGGNGSTSCLLRYLKTTEKKSNKYHLILGSDTHNDLMGGKWKSAEEIIRLIDAIEVVVRQGFQIIEGTALSEGVRVNRHEIPTLGATSSTAVRVELASGQGGSETTYLHPQVLEYIYTHGLYETSILSHFHTGTLLCVGAVTAITMGIMYNKGLLSVNFF